MTIDAQHVTAKSAGSLEPGEILTDVLLPPPASRLRTLHRKVRARASWDFALVSVGLALHVTGARVEAARVVLGGVAPVPWRSIEAEKALLGRSLDAATAALAGEAAVKGAEPMEQNPYKIPLLRCVMEQAILSLAAPS